MKFAGFEYDRQRGELRHAASVVSLQEQPLKLLGLLLEQPGDIVSRDRICLALWDGAYGDREHGINTAVRKLRATLKQYAGEDEVAIATSSGQGYRIVLATVRTVQQVAIDPVGYDAFLTGRFLFSQRNPPSLLAAKQHFELACERNPEFALAHACLSRTCRFLTIFEMARPAPLWEQAEKHAQLAVKLEPQLSEAHSAMACVLARYRWQWKDGCEAYGRALRLNPDNAETLCDYGVALLAMGCFDEGVKRLDQVLALDPRYAVGRATVALGWLMQGRKDEAVAMLTGMTVAMPDFLTAWIYLGIEQLNRGEWAEAERSCSRMLELAPGRPTFLGLQAHAKLGLGKAEELAAIAAQLDALCETRYISPTALSMVKTATGEMGAAREAVRQAVTQRDANFALYRRMRMFDSIRETPEFGQTLQAMNLGRD